MSFDEKVIALINRKRKTIAAAVREEQIIKSIQTGGDCVIIDGFTLKLEEKSFFDGQVKLKIPAELAVLSAEKTRLKYPSASQPDLILTTRDELFNITFKHSRLSLDEAAVEQFKDRMITVIQKKQSRVSWQETGVKQINGRKIGFCNFTVPALDTNVFNMMFFGELNRRVLIGNMNCPVARMDYWKPIVNQLVESIKITAAYEDTPAKQSSGSFEDYLFKPGFYAGYHNQEYRVFKLAEGNYRLISSDPGDLADGFEKKDGVYKKTVSDAEFQSLFELKIKIVYRGNVFELGEVRKNEVRIIKKPCDFDLARQLQLEKDSWSGEYGKWINKNEIEDVIEEKRSIK